MVSSHLSAHRENLSCWLTAFRQKGEGSCFSRSEQSTPWSWSTPQGEGASSCPMEQTQVALLPRPTSSGRASVISDGAGSGGMEKDLKLLRLTVSFRTCSCVYCCLGPWSWQPQSLKSLPTMDFGRGGLWVHGPRVRTAFASTAQTLGVTLPPRLPVLCRVYLYLPPWISGHRGCTLPPCPMCPTELTPVLHTQGAQDKPRDSVHPSGLMTAIEEPKAQFLMR